MRKIELKYDPRPQQTEMLDFVKDSVDAEKKFMIMDAPTGTGKSYAAVMIADWYTSEFNKDAKVDILTNTKLLQDQYTEDFKFMGSLKGSNNYWCRTNLMNCGESKVYNRSRGKRCETCSHTIAQSAFLRERVSLTNFHLMTAYSIYSPDMLADRKSNLLIIDESHSFEETFCDFISSSFSEFSLNRLGIWEPWMESDLDDIMSIESLADYVSSVIGPRLLNHMAELIEEAKQTGGKKKKSELVKLADLCDKSMCKYNRFINDRENYAKNWVFSKELDQSGKVRMLVEPIWGNQYLKETFWDKYDHVIFMSGSIIDPKMFAFLMGLEEDSYTYLDLPCPFDVAKRPVIYLKFGKMSYYDKTDTFKRAVPIIQKILDKNKGNKGIIHSGNYQFSEWIRRQIKNKRLLISDSSSREDSLKKHLVSQKDTVLVSPSMINGIDLKDDLSRFQIILKVPFPNLRSEKIKKRLEMMPDWYNWKSLMDIIQAYGRSIRNEEDWAETYILDACFDQVRAKNLPGYFKDALKVKKLNK